MINRFKRHQLIPRTDLQYHTPRGSAPTQVAALTARHGPPPGQGTKSRYPHRYGNRENAGPTFQPWEIKNSGENLIEHPINPGFNPNQRVTPMKKVNKPVHPEARARLAQKPHNDRGAIRVVTSENHQRVMGVNYHPEGNIHGFARAPLTPRDRKGREQLNAHNRKVARKSNTN